MGRGVNGSIRRAGKRIAPPDRRQSETRRIEWGSSGTGIGSNVTIFVTLGYDESFVRPVEIFYDRGYRRGSELDILCSDICIILSILLQHEDIEPESFCRSLARERDLRSGDERFSSLIGLFLEEIQKPPAWADGGEGE